MSEPEANPHVAENNAREEARQEEAWRLRPKIGPSREEVLKGVQPWPKDGQDSATLLEAMATMRDWWQRSLATVCPCCGRKR